MPARAAAALPGPSDSELRLAVHQVGPEAIDNPGELADPRPGEPDLRVQRHRQAGEAVDFRRVGRRRAIPAPRRVGGGGITGRGDFTLPSALAEPFHRHRRDDGDPVHLRGIGIGAKEDAHSSSDGCGLGKLDGAASRRGESCVSVRGAETGTGSLRRCGGRARRQSRERKRSLGSHDRTIAGTARRPGSRADAALRDVAGRAAGRACRLVRRHPPRRDAGLDRRGGAAAPGLLRPAGCGGAGLHLVGDLPPAGSAREAHRGTATAFRSGGAVRGHPGAGPVLVSFRTRDGGTRRGAGLRDGVSAAGGAARSCWRCWWGSPACGSACTIPVTWSWGSSSRCSPQQGSRFFADDAQSRSPT